MRFASKANIFPGSKIRMINEEAIKLARQGIRIYNFHIGQPGLPPSKELLVDFTKELLERPFELSMYTPSNGIEELRNAIAEDYTKYSGIKVTASNISVAAGSAEALLALFMTIIDEGDEAILLDPTYLMYEPLIKYLGGRVIKVRAKEDLGWLPDDEELKNAVGRKTKTLIIVNPDNPTGRVLSERHMKLIVDLASDYDAYVIYDEAI